MAKITLDLNQFKAFKELIKFVDSGVSIAIIVKTLQIRKDVANILFNSTKIQFNEKNLSQCLYHFMNNFENIQKCKCGNNLKFKGYKFGYYKTCGDKTCANSLRIQSTKEYFIKNYGVENCMQIKETVLKVRNTIKNTVYKKSPMIISLNNKNKEKYLYVYKVVDKNSGEFYFGSRKSLLKPNLDKKYLGSMSTWKPDKNNLIKTVIKSDFNSVDEMIQFESNIIIDNINHRLNRNYHVPKIGFSNTNKKMSNEQKKKLSDLMKGCCYVKNEEGTVIKVKTDDSRIKSGELVSIFKGRKLSDKTKKILSTQQQNKVSVKNENGQIFRLDKNNPRIKNEGLVNYRLGNKYKINNFK